MPYTHEIDIHQTFPFSKKGHYPEAVAYKLRDDKNDSAKEKSKLKSFCTKQLDDKAVNKIVHTDPLARM